MDHEMIERCVLALEQNFKNRIATHAGMAFADTEVSLPNRDVWYSYAETVIKAMREPTEKMLEATRLSDSIVEAWQSMIDSIINE